MERLLGFDGDAEQTGKVRVDLFPFLNQAFDSSEFCRRYPCAESPSSGEGVTDTARAAGVERSLCA